MELAKPRSYYLATWNGRIILINTILFLLTTYYGGSLFTPDSATLIRFGAKYPIGIAGGELYRFITPIFLHVGILHFSLNNLALKVVGRVMEAMVPAWFFLAVYVLSGVLGNIFSTLDNTVIGAGASGSIFGLIGVGCAFEVSNYLIAVSQYGFRFAQLPRFFRSPFILTAWLNLFIGYILNVILNWIFSSHFAVDNSAHWGGLICGFVLGLSYVLARRKIFFNCLALIAMTLALAAAAVSLETSSYIPNLYAQAAKESDDVGESYFLWSQSLRAKPQYIPGLLARIEMAAKYDELGLVCDDLLTLSSTEGYPMSLFLLKAYGKAQGKDQFLAQIRAFNEALSEGRYYCPRR